MKKKFIILLVMFISLVNIDKVDALYNGSGGTGFTATGTSNSTCGTAQNCSWNNDNMLILQVRLYYINNGSFSPIGKTYYFVNNVAYKYFTETLKLDTKTLKFKLEYISKLDGCTGADKYLCASNYLKEDYFGDIEGNPEKDTAKEFLKEVTGKKNYLKVLTKKSEFANKKKPATKGYRIIIEPAHNYENPSFSKDKYAIITVKGLAQEGVDEKTISCLGTPGGTVTGCRNPLLGVGSKAQLLYTDFKDVGISAASKEKCENVKLGALADIKKGCGYNIVDISQYVKEQECYTKSSSGSLTCENTDENNITNFTETYTKLESCPKDTTEDEAKQTTESGKLIATSGTCSIYCKETATASFPGNVGTLIKRGSYFAWPTRPDDVTGKYSMSMKSTFTCEIIDEGGSGDTVAATYTRKCPEGTVEYDDDQCRSQTETKKRKCPDGYSLSGDNITCYSNDYSCDEGYDKVDGTCKKTTYSCPEGYTIKDKKCYQCDSDYSYNSNSKKCKSNKTSCPDNYNDCTEKKCNKDNKNNCYKKVCKSNHTACKSNVCGENNKSKCYYYAVSYKCPDSSVLSSTYPGKCTKTSSKQDCNRPYTYDNGSCSCTKCANTVYEMKYSDKINDYASKEYKYKDVKDTKDATATTTYGTVYRTTSQSYCPKNTVDVGGTCYKLKEKVKGDYKCSKNYTLDGKQCKKTCNKDSLKEAARNQLKKLEYEAHLTAGTNNPISNISLDTIEDGIKEKKDNDGNFVYSNKVYFKIPDNINRYYNRITGIVSNDGPSSNVLYDRKEGVVSLGLNDVIIENNLIKKYDLKISDVKLGTGNQFGAKITNYVCHYSITDNGECICPDGTTNAGVSISYLKEEICESVSANKTCSEWQEDLCNYDTTQSNYPELCTSSGKYYCVNKDGRKEDITTCVSSLMTSNKKNLMESIEQCTLTVSSCKSNYCINKKTNQKIDITECLEENSRMTCLKKYGCLNKYCNPGECCTGKCSWDYKKVSNVIYGIETCDNNEKCNFEAYCSTDKSTSKSTKSCIENELRTDNILDKLNNINESELNNAIKKCEAKICTVNQKIIYRVIDLNNPFPGKKGKNRTPGENWNSQNTISEKILNARGVESYKLYTKEPLYKITLTPNDIKKIREYNKNNAYDNFNLKCTEKNEASCISYFLHSNDTNDIKLNITGVSSCTRLNASSTIEDFNKCYNSDN